MKKFLTASLIAASLFVTMTGFQCGSPEMTSAKLYIQRLDWASAETSLMQEVAKNPNNAEAWYWLGRARFEMKNYTGIHDPFERSLKISNQFEKDIRGLQFNGWVLLYNGGVEAMKLAHATQGDSAHIFNTRAIENFQNALILNKDSSSTYLNLGLAYMALDDFSNGSKNLEIAMRKDQDPVLATSLAGRYLERGRLTQSGALNATGAEKDALTKSAKEDFEKAISLLGSARKWAPDDATATSLLLDCYIAAGRTDEAMTVFGEAAKKNPSNKLLAYNYGVLLIKAGRHDEALAQFRNALAIDPKFEDALYNIGIGYLQVGARMRTEAEAKARDSGKNQPIDKAYEQKFEESRKFLEQLSALKPDDVEVWEALGQVYANLNMQKQASAAYDKADALKKNK